MNSKNSKFLLIIMSLAITASVLFVFSPRDNRVPTHANVKAKEEKAEDTSEKMKLRVSGMSRDMAVYSVFQLTLTSGEIGLKKEYEATLDSPASEMFFLKKSNKTAILSGDRKSIYVFDEISMKFENKVISFFDKNKNPDEISCASLNAAESLLAVSLSSSQKIEVFSTTWMQKVFSIDTAAGKCSKVFFDERDTLYYTAERDAAVLLYKCEPPYSSSSELYRLSLPVGVFAALPGSGNFIFYNENSNATFGLNLRSLENSMILPAFAPKSSQQNNISALLPLSSKEFGLIRGDVGEIAIFENNGQKMKVECGFLDGSGPVTSFPKDLKYSFIGASKGAEFSFFEKASKKFTKKNRLSEISSISAASLSGI